MAAEIITKEDLQTFKQELLAEFKILINSKPKGTVTDEWLKSSQVRKLLNISPGTLQNLRVQNRLPFTKIGGIIYYKRRDIIDLMENKK
ncbi:DNA-binding protein [Mucilaginibacter terrenus]|uniref:DNA-binding protein n=1 Tax=Mucilaginibacter terrenus TaxID=2482727 RepID=A0A3E2NWH1_9SPHI|nr:helix-turn-helix domain-containing protein [Mucilaginibacter terrenus]RFZ85271.1 DNA-binding protein [Mucilaginibacter terrenus]